MKCHEIIDIFCAKAAVVGAVVVRVHSEDEAIDYVMQLAARKAPCELLTDERTQTRSGCVVAAPDLAQPLYDALVKASEGNGIFCMCDGLRAYLAGVDIGFTTALCAVAASGTCVVQSDSEEKRLATMISEICVLLVKASDIYAELSDITPLMRHMQQHAGGYCAFISGPSRTADIERVPAVGVHGPLEQHIIILEDAVHA